MQLAQLLDAAGLTAEMTGDGETAVTGLAYDSRRVEPGALFFCISGLASDGHEFAAAAVDAGAAALVVERSLDAGVPEVRVPDARAAMGPVAAAFWGRPSDELDMAGVTGTNGKTTTAFLIREILEASGRRCGLLGTVQMIVGGKPADVERTTPEAIDLQATFRAMLDAGDAACAMEVSSHALQLGRVDGTSFDVSVFTNLTQDHLDFHGSMEEYFAAKRLLFERDEGIAVINIDDSYGRRLADDCDPARLITFSAAGGDADLSARNLEFDFDGSSFDCASSGGEIPVRTTMPGRFNVENALAALGAGEALGVGLREGAAALARAGRVPGRFEPIDEGQEFGVLVDYAHTPDSLENVLEAARPLAAGRLITVFGCGGDRDRDKRPQMGAIGAAGSDLAIVTSDNPRSEDPVEIIRQIMAGVPETGAVLVEPDRQAAIAAAFERAQPGDLVVIAGKGHEQGQEFEDGRKIPFDDRDVARAELRRQAAGAAQ